MGHLKASGLRYRQKEGRALQALGLKRGRNNDIGVHNKPQREHYRFDLSVLDALMICSI